ncbi:hypothetical protein A0H81_02546 [Grifola frondosa]|uniref:Amine oxidase domain-containing protein n=1 Tax=Grifola frondosa TaxID=5627 RepID=A0A1C7MLA6_GRIFR|nr:hypothetical protein A0H81_02546 [Grifola frondosa]
MTQDPVSFASIDKSFTKHEVSFRDLSAHVVVQDVIDKARSVYDTPDASPPPSTISLGVDGSLRPRPICIVGAGVAGLYAAMILQDLGIEYEILESSDRIGGRIFTHRFNGQAGYNAPINTPARYDYFDVGAMRFPRIPFMERVFDLFGRIGINDLLIEYKLRTNNNLMYYNTKPPVTGFQSSAADDHFGISIESGGTVPNGYVAQGVDFWTGEVYDHYKDLFGALDTVALEKRQAVFERAWLELIKQDHHSVRGATGLYDMAFVESVLDSLDFDWPNPLQSTRPCHTQANPPGARHLNKKLEEWKWVCIDGGSDHIVHEMAKRLKVQPQLKQRVTKIVKCEYQTMLVIANGVEREYSHVISTIPLSCLGSIDLDGCDLLYSQKQAIRSLQYDSSTKVGIKFEGRWWEDETVMGSGRTIQGGQSSTDVPIRTCVYPSYGLKCPSPPGVLIASYTWAQDARRIGTLADSPGSEADKLLLELTLDNLAKLHGIPREKIPPVVDHFAHSWDNDEHARGAFALYGPAQFGHPDNAHSMFAAIKAPAADGLLHFAGEATSVHHAWVLGSLNSAWRAVYNALNGRPEKQKLLIERWGIPDEENEVHLKQLHLLAHYKVL